MPCPPVTYAAPQQVDYIQQTQVEYFQQARVTNAAPLTYAAIQYGDMETHAIDADTSDLSPHQFITPDDAMGSNDHELEAANNDAARSKMLSAEIFDNEDVP